MDNKEKLKKSINKDFNKKNNYNAIIRKIEGEEMKNKINIWKWSLIPICLVMIISGVMLSNLDKYNNNLLEPKRELTDESYQIKLNINHIDTASTTKIDADIKTISTKGEITTNLDFLKNNIQIPEDLDKVDSYSIYTKNKNSQEYDILNCYVYNYSNENHEKNIRIAFSDTNKPIRDYRFSDKNSKETIIEDVKLTIYQYGNTYFVELTYKGYNFDIEADNITEQELLDLLFSIIF